MRKMKFALGGGGGGDGYELRITKEGKVVQQAVYCTGRGFGIYFLGFFIV